MSASHTRNKENVVDDTYSFGEVPNFITQTSSIGSMDGVRGKRRKKSLTKNKSISDDLSIEGLDDDWK